MVVQSWKDVTVEWDDPDHRCPHMDEPKGSIIMQRPRNENPKGIRCQDCGVTGTIIDEKTP